jgi:hypothetical protein
VAVLIDHSRYDGFSADGSQFGHVPYGLRFDIWGPLSPGLVRPVAVVMEQVLAEHRGQVPFTDDQDPVQQFAAESPMTRSQMAFIRGVLDRVVMIRSPSALNTSPNAAVNSGSRS